MLQPDKPTRADHRYIKRLLDTSFKGKVEHLVEEYNHVIKVFKRAGGSWERLFKGSTKDIELLKKIIKLAIAKGHMTKAQKF